MLGKLMKYELRATGRVLLPLYAAFLVMTLIAKIFVNINSEATGFMISAGLVTTLYVIVIVGIAVMTFIMIIQRFYKNLMTDEGYLMFTLPVPVWQQVVSKMLLGLFWSVVCVIAVILSLFIIALDPGSFSQFISALINIDWRAFNEMNGVLICIEILVCMLVSTVASMSQIYCAIALGQLSDKHKIVMAVVAYIAISVILQTVATTAIVGLSVNAETMGLNAFFAAMDAPDVLQWMFNGITLGNLIFGGIMFAVTTYILKNKLNLE